MTVPVYLRIADEIEAAIARQPVGTELPSENELARTHKISRLTARASLEELERRCLVRRTRGKRASVAHRIGYIIGPERSPSWSEGVKSAGAMPRSQIDRLLLRKPPTAVREALSLNASEQALFLARTRFVDGMLAAVADTWLAADLVPMLAERMLPDASLYATLSSFYRLMPCRGWTRAEFIFAPASVARRLDVEGRPSVVRLTGTTISQECGRVIEFTTSWLRADVFNVVFEMGTL